MKKTITFFKKSVGSTSSLHAFGFKQGLSALRIFAFVATFFFLSANSVLGQATLVGWTFTALPTQTQLNAGLSVTSYTNVIGNSTNQNAKLTTSSGALVGAGSSPNFYANATGAVGHYWQIEFSSLGYSSIHISSSQIANNENRLTYIIEYSLNGGAFTEIISAYKITSKAAASPNVQSFDLPAAANQTNIKIRWRCTALSSTATSRIGFISVTGSSASSCTTPTTSFVSSSVNKLTTDAAFTNAFATNNSSTKVWSSSNETVATVDADGLVTIHNAGTTSIKVNQAADATYCTVVDASYALTVTAPPAPDAPTATAATAVTSSGFTANWGAVSGATEYDVNVYTKTAGASASDLFISEYGEGTSNNKYIEIFNGTGATVDLSNYTLKQASEGGGWDVSLSYTLPLSGVLANNDVYVICASTASATILAVADLTIAYDVDGIVQGGKVIYFTGNDAMGLFKGNTLIDVFGNPASSATISIAGGAYGNNHTIVRKSSVIAGNTSWDASSGIDESSSEWIVNANDVTTYLGSHTLTGGSTNTPISDLPFSVSGSTNKVVTGLSSGTAYYYTVVAKDGVSTSVASNEITAITNVDGSTNASTLPSCATCDLVINNTGTFTIDAAKTYNSITVESGGKLNTTAPLTVGNLILKAVKDESSFSSIIDATITATSAKLFKTIDDTKWYYMAFPCDVTVADITKSNGESIGVLGTDWFIKYYDGEQRGNNGTAQTNWKHIEAIPTLTANRGYIFGLKTGTVELSIPLNSSVLAAESTDKNIAVAANKGAAANTNHGWNLIGHPYMSKYNARSNGSAPDYMIMPNPDGKTYTQTSKGAGTLPADLKPFAAYFVQVGAAGNIGFGRNGRQNVPASVAAEVSENIRLNLTTATGADYTYLIMDNDQTTEYQIGEDMVKWLGTGTDVPQVYTLIGDVSYAFNALPMASVVNLPIGLYTKNAGASTISVNALQAPSLSKLLLTDKTENITTDLLISDYSFNATAGSDNTRFVMSAQRISTGDQINLIDAPSVISSKGKLIINELSPKTNIRIYDATGRLVMSKVATERSIEIPLQVVGMYAVHIDAGIKNWTIKIVNNK